MWSAAAILAAVVLAGGASEAAAHGRGSHPSRSGGHGRPGGPVVDEEMRAALEQVMKVRLKQVLQLTAEQEGRVMPRVDKLQEARHGFATRRRAAIAHLRGLVNDEASRPADIEKALRGVRDLESSFRTLEASLREEIEAELDPRQQARLYFFEARFRREMQRRLQDGAGRVAGPGERGRGAGGPPLGEPDPDSTGEDDL
jgi:hypothetical protein